MDISKNYSEKSDKNPFQSYFKLNREISIQTTTWINDTPGIFDYENENIITNQFKLKCTSQTYCILKLDNSFRIIHSSELNYELELFPHAKHICDISIDSQSIYLIPKFNDSDDSVNRLWMMLKASEIQPEIQQGDLIKLGKVKLHIRNLITSEQDSHYISSNLSKEFYNSLNDINSKFSRQKNIKSPILGFIDSNNSDRIFKKDKLCDETSSHDDNYEEIEEYPLMSRILSSNKNLDENSVNYCRFCLSEEDEIENPLISPCNCRGSSGSIHLLCLRTWMNDRLEINSKTDSFAFHLKELSCELCHAKYPATIKKFNTIYDLLDIPLPQAPFMIIEPIHEKKVFHVISLKNKKYITIGRGMEADVRLTNISVSRIHATLKYDKDSIYLEDNNSKFGTLMEVTRAIKLKNNQELNLQFGNSLIHIKLKKSLNFKILSSCFQNSNSSIDILPVISIPSNLLWKKNRISDAHTNPLIPHV